MKFSVSSSALLSLLATTGKVISNKNTLPILDYFLMELSGNELKVTTSDLETTLIGSITVDSVESEGTIAAPAKLMLDSLKEFSELPLTIDVNDKNWEITINWKSGSLSIPGASAVSYPAVPQLSAEKKELSMDVDTLVNGINKTIVATADGSLGVGGLVTDAIAAAHPAYGYFYACGPLPMLRALCQTLPTPGEVSLEERMGCGFGACMGCTCQTAGGPRRICLEGPVFRKEEIRWNEIPK